jgi:hypothetical protein
MFTEIQFPFTLYYIVPFTTVVWIVGTLFTAPVPIDHLKKFYRKVHPGGPGWRNVARECPEVQADSGYWSMMLCWLASAGMTYGILFGVGKIVLGDLSAGALWLLLAGVMIAVMYRIMTRVGWEKAIE